MQRMKSAKKSRVFEPYILYREKAKLTDKSGDGVDDVYTPKWIHFHWLHFLDDFIVAKKSRSNFEKVNMPTIIITIYE